MRALGKGSIAEIIRIGLVIAWVVLWIAALVLALGAIAYAAVLWLSQTGVIDADDLLSGLLKPTDANPAGAIWPVATIGFLIGGVSVGGALIIVARLRSLFDSFSTGEPFRRENATHLRVIWVTMLFVEVARMLLTAILSALVAVFGPSNGVGVRSVELNFELSTWASILILIVLAEVFREGARLKEEQELTI